MMKRRVYNPRRYVFYCEKERLKFMEKTKIYTIYPHQMIYRYGENIGTFRIWVFDDEERGLKNEALVSGTDIILDKLTESIPNADRGFALTFSNAPFPGYSHIFEWIRSDEGNDMGMGIHGNWYKEQKSGLVGWLCPALFKYFDFAPKSLYVRALKENEHDIGTIAAYFSQG